MAIDDTGFAMGGRYKVEHNAEYVVAYLNDQQGAEVTDLRINERAYHIVSLGSRDNMINSYSAEVDVTFDVNTIKHIIDKSELHEQLKQRYNELGEQFQIVTMELKEDREIRQQMQKAMEENPELAAAWEEIMVMFKLSGVEREIM